MLLSKTPRKQPYPGSRGEFNSKMFAPVKSGKLDKQKPPKLVEKSISVMFLVECLLVGCYREARIKTGVSMRRHCYSSVCLFLVKAMGKTSCSPRDKLLKIMNAHLVQTSYFY